MGKGVSINKALQNLTRLIGGFGYNYSDNKHPVIMVKNYQEDITEHTLLRWGINFSKTTFDISNQTIYKLS